MNEILSAEEATELAAQVAELTRAGLPLGPGLEALAEELGGGRLARVLRSMAARLDAGATLPEVIEAHRDTLPIHLRGLLTAALQSGRLPEAMHELVDIQRKRDELRRRVRVALAYPAVLVVMLIALSLLILGYVVPEFAKMFADFEMDLPAMTALVIWISRSGGKAIMSTISFFVAAYFMLWMMPGASWPRRLLYYIPLIGPLRRWSRLAECLHLAGLLLEQKIPLPDAMRMTAEGIQDRDLSAACLRAAGRLRAGQPIGESLRAARQFPPAMIPLVEWGQRTGALPEAFRTAAEFYEGRAQIQQALMDIMLVPIMCIFMFFAIGFFIIALMLPLIVLIQKMT